MMSWRGAVVLLLHTSVVVNVLPRYNMSIAMVCMVNRHRTPPEMGNSTSNETLLTYTQPNISGKEPRLYEFDWNSEIQGLLLTGVQFASFLGPLVAIFIQSKIGGKLSLVVFAVSASVLSILSPIAARTNPYILLVIRIASGVTSGTTAPVIGQALAWWSPDSEKLTWVAVTFAGFPVGGALCSFMSGYLCTATLDNGWPLIFYLTGVLNLIWLVAWLFLYTDKPEEHLYISEGEKNYIIANRIGMTNSSDKKIKAPIKKILTSIPVLAYIYSWANNMWTTAIFFIYLPQYISGALKFSTQETGVIVSVVTLARFLGTFFWTGVCNWLMTLSSMNKSKVRKICILAGLCSAGAVNVLLCFLDQEYKVVNVVILIVIMLLQAVGNTVLTVLPLDMAPMFAGFITSINTSFSMLVSISAPLVVANIAINNTFEEWRLVWILTIISYSSAGIVFGLFGQATLQPWAESKKEDAPNIVLPFVSMGHRFSTIHQTHSVTTLNPSKRFDFSLNAKLAFMLSAMAETPNGMKIADKLKLNMDMSPSIRSTRPDFFSVSTQTSWPDERKGDAVNDVVQADSARAMFVLTTDTKRIKDEKKENNVECDVSLSVNGDMLEENPTVF